MLVWYRKQLKSLFADFVDVTDVTEVCVINRYLICEHCKLLIPDVDNLDDHVCEAAAAVASEGEKEMVVELSAKGYQCEYCNKTFAQVTQSRTNTYVLMFLGLVELTDKSFM